jgi:hypothetical protein
MIDTMESAYRCVSGQYIPGDEKLIKTIGIFQLIFKLEVEQQTHLVKKSSLNCCLQTNEYVGICICIN